MPDGIGYKNPTDYPRCEVSALYQRLTSAIGFAAVDRHQGIRDAEARLEKVTDLFVKGHAERLDVQRAIHELEVLWMAELSRAQRVAGTPPAPRGKVEIP